MSRVAGSLSTDPRRALRVGDALAVGLDRFAPTFDEELNRVASGAGVFKAIRGEYGSGKTFITRWLAEDTEHTWTFTPNPEADSLVLALTLVVTPVTYSLFEDARERRVLARGFGWMRSKLPLQNPVTPA